MKKSFLLSLLCVILFTACHKKDTPPAPFLKADRTALNFTAAAGSVDVTISSNIDWSISGLPSWLTASKTSGTSGDTKVTFTYAANSAVNSLTATISINGNGVTALSITVTQLGGAPSMMSDKTALTEKPEGQLDSVLITSNVPWSLAIPTTASWITADKTTGSAGVTKVRFTVTNNTSLMRQASLTLSSTTTGITPLTLNFSQGQPDVNIASWDSHAAGDSNIAIHGAGFSSTLSENVVKINNIIATIVSGTTSSLVVKVPLKAGSGNINITVGSKAATAIGFTNDWQWVVSTLAGGTQGYVDGIGTVAKFNRPQGISVDANNNLYVSDYYNNVIRKVTPAGLVSTFAGSGTAGSTDGTIATALFNLPEGLKTARDNNLYLVEFGNNRLRKISTDGTVSTIAGSTNGFADNMNGTNAKFNFPTDVALDGQGNAYVADFNNNRIRKVTPNGDVTTLAGSGTAGSSDGSGGSAQFNGPAGITMAGDGNLYVCDYHNHLIRKVTLSGEVTTLAGSTGSFADGTGSNAKFNSPLGITWSPIHNALFVAAQGNNMIRKVTLSGEVTSIAGAITEGYVEGLGSNARFASPQFITIDSFGNIYVTDNVNNAIRKIVYQ